MKKNLSVALSVFFLSLVFVFAITLHLWITKNGAGIGPDSITYIGTANSLIQENGFAIKGPSHFPPVYPILLAISGMFSSNVVDSARWVHSLLYAVNAVLFVVTIYLGTKRNGLAAIFGFLIFFSSSAVLTIHAYAWSESPFLMFSLISYLLFSFFITTGRWIYLVCSSVSLGLALATRYVGLALLPPVIISLFLLVKQPLRYKIKAFFIMVVLSLTPVSLWLLRNLLLTQSAANRSFAYHPRNIRKFCVTLLEVLHDFILPNPDSNFFMAGELLIIVLMLAFMIFVLIKKRTATNPYDLFGISSIALGLFFSISYVLMVSFSIFFFDAATTFNERILLPVYLFLTISVICLVFLFSNQEKRRTVWLLFLVCVLFSVRFNIFPAMDAAKDIHANGLGYNARIWNESPTLSILKAMNPDREVYSNGVDVITFKTGLIGDSLPSLFSPTTLVKNETYKEKLLSICGKVLDGSALIIYLDEIGRDYLPTEEKLLEKCQLPILFDTNDGTIFGLPEIK